MLEAQESESLFGHQQGIAILLNKIGLGRIPAKRAESRYLAKAYEQNCRSPCERLLPCFVMTLNRRLVDCGLMRTGSLSRAGHRALSPVCPGPIDRDDLISDVVFVPVIMNRLLTSLDVAIIIDNNKVPDA